MSVASYIRRYNFGILIPLSLLIVEVVLLLRSIAQSSLWIDEYIAVMFADRPSILQLFRGDNMFDILAAPLWPAIMYFMGHLFGQGEFILRLPSLLAVLGGAAVFFVLLRKCFSIELSLAGVALLLAMPGVKFTAITARPYGMVLFFAILSVYSIVKWLETDRRFWAVVFIAASTGVVASHYLCGVIFAVFGLFWVWLIDHDVKRAKSFFSRLLLPASICSALLFLPLFAVWGKRSEVVCYSGGSLRELADVYVPSILCFGLLLGMAIAVLSRQDIKSRYVAVDPGTVVLMGSLYLAPALVFYLVSSTIGPNMFVERYYGLYHPGLVFLLVWIVSHIRGQGARTIVLCSLVMTVLLSNYAQPNHSWEDAVVGLEQEVMASGLSDEKVELLFQSHFVETNNLEWLQEKGMREIFELPLRYYGYRGDLKIVPWRIETAEQEQYLRSEINDSLEQGSKIILFQSFPFLSLERAVILQLSANGYQLRKIRKFLDKSMLVFER